MATGEDEAPSASDRERRARFRILDLSAVGLAFPVALLLGYFGGRLIGGWLGNARVGSMIGALLGIAGGFYNLLQMVSRLAPRGPASTPPGALAAEPTAAADPEEHDLLEDDDDPEAEEWEPDDEPEDER
jgi:hypothetical protein